MTDCMIIGYNDFDFHENVKLVEAAGRHSGSFRDFRLSSIEYNSRYRRPLDILSLFHAQGGDGDGQNGEGHGEVLSRFHDMDFLWPTITYLATYLHLHDFSFDFVNLFQFEKEKLKAKLEAGDVVSIAITTTLYVHPRPILEIIDFIRRYNSQVLIIVGGPYISSQSKGLAPAEFASLLRYIDADYYIINREGEKSLVDLLTAIKSGAHLKNIANLAYFEGGELIRTLEVPEQNDLEQNRVDYSLFNKEDMGEFLSIRTAKSCPFACAFCGFPQRSGKYVYLTSDLIEKELNRINDLGTVSTLTILDDTFNVPKGRFREILNIMIRNKYDFKWNCFYRCDQGDRETIELMGEAGCEGVFLGVESGSDFMLKQMNKTCRSQHYLEAIPWFREAGVSTHANLIVGFPGETRETFEESMELIEKTAPDFFLGQLWFCDPLTPVWQRREELGIEGTGFTWKHRTMDYHEACDLVDEMFFNIRNSLWLPQWGMAPWSTYYLQRKGMALAQIKHFISCYNDVVRHQVNHSGQEIIPESLLKPLRESCRLSSCDDHRKLPQIDIETSSASGPRNSDSVQ